MVTVPPVCQGSYGEARAYTIDDAGPLKVA
jgi:hypothetical protein